MRPGRRALPALAGCLGVVRFLVAGPLAGLPSYWAGTCSVVDAARHSR